jgi:hypothetical protein
MQVRIAQPLSIGSATIISIRRHAGVRQQVWVITRLVVLAAGIFGLPGTVCGLALGCLITLPVPSR